MHQKACYVASTVYLSDNGTTGEITLQGGGPVLYGPFNKLVSATIAAGSALIAYRG